MLGKLHLVPTGLWLMGQLVFLPTFSPSGTVPEGQYIGRKQNTSRAKSHRDDIFVKVYTHEISFFRKSQ